MSTLEPRASGLPIDVAGLRKTFGNKVALADFALQLRRGQVFGAVGANGGGKTTALRILAGLLPAEAGRGRVLGVDLRTHPSRLREHVGYMTQHYSLYRDLTVTENLLARARIFGVADPHRRAAELVAQFRLERFARERVGRLSGGWMRRAQFAVVLVPAPLVLLLDEPTTGLDFETSCHLWEAVVELAAQGTTILISTHDLVEAGRCDLVGVFLEGLVVAQGTAEQIIQRSAVQVGRVPAGRMDVPSLYPAIPELAFVRLSAGCHYLVFRGKVTPQSLAWLQARNLPPQFVEPTLEDAMSLLSHKCRPQP
jgi:ABC-2 type transport system ATP-binding protein